jgi:hypothetical protein
MLAEAQSTPISELVPPLPAPPVVRKRESPVIDGGSAQQACDMEEKPEQSQPHKPRYAV